MKRTWKKKKKCKLQMLIKDLQPSQPWLNMKKISLITEQKILSSLIIPLLFSKMLEDNVSTSECYNSKWETSKGCKMILSISNHEDFFSHKHSEAVARRCFIKKAVLDNLKELTGKNLCRNLFLIKLQT